MAIVVAVNVVLMTAKISVADHILVCAQPTIKHTFENRDKVSMHLTKLKLPLPSF